MNAVERQGQIPGKSPTEVLLNTLEHRNYTLDDLYRGLHKMEHRQAMEIISKYGTHVLLIRYPHKNYAQILITLSVICHYHIIKTIIPFHLQTKARKK